MKKILLTAASLMMFSAVSFSQNVNAALYKSKIERSNADIQDPKKNVKSSTWLSRGKAFYDTAVANNFKIFAGMPEADMIEKIGNPVNAKEIPTETYNGVNYLKYQYKGVDIYLLADQKTVDFWIETEPIYPGALEESKKAYLKAIEIDPAAQKKATDGLIKVMNAYRSVAGNVNKIGKSAEAGQNFGAAYEIGSMDIINDKDADSWAYYAGVFGAITEDFDATIKYLSPLAEAGTFEENGDTYYYLAYAYQKKGNFEEAEKNYLKGIEKYPSNQKLLQDLISLYIEMKEDPSKVIPYIKKGQESDPNNVVFFLAEGIAYNSMKEYDKAIEAFNNALKVNPDYFEALYSIGTSYYEKAGQLNTELSNVDYTNAKLRDELTAKIYEAYRNALPSLEKAHSLKPEDRSTVEFLKSIYFVLRDQSPEMQANYDKYNELFKSM